MTHKHALLLSLRPRYADAILAGDKTIEIRRRPINAAIGIPVVLYASSPMSAVVGTARLADVRICDPGTAWQQHCRDLGLSRAELDAYLDGATLAYLLLLRHVQPLDDPLPLRHLRQDAPFQPPQSFRYVTASDPTRLRELIHA